MNNNVIVDVPPVNLTVGRRGRAGGRWIIGAGQLFKVQVGVAEVVEEVSHTRSRGLASEVLNGRQVGHLIDDGQAGFF